jgi:DNA invertase Pin-like site-specific DNA recombinase
VLVGSNTPKRKRCAVYARKSSEEGLEQDFNSLDAQREACMAYIKSQKSEGWKPIRTHYEDGGYSGGNLDRPALTQLLADIESRKIDTVVVYKVDRLTRSLTDFARIVEVLDSNGASFVSVTQQFNTTTSMGRLTLNMLLSFAQFEREVTGERIRDKIAASKRKGLWMGGRVPLGYRANGRTLEIERVEAKIVRLLFALYLELGSVRQLKREADQRGLRTKLHTDTNGKTSGGRPFGRGSLYHLLSNPIYAGRVPHKDESFEGQHEAIIDAETWVAVQKQLADQAPPPSRTDSDRSSNPLRGKIFDESGVRLTPSHTVKSGRRYRYYVSRNEASAAAEISLGDTPKSAWRLPGREIERFVEQAVLNLFRNPEQLARLVRSAKVSRNRLPALLERAHSRAHEPLSLVERVDLTSDEITIEIGLASLLPGQPKTIQLAVPARIRRRGVEQKLVVPGAGSSATTCTADPALLGLVARSRHWFESITSGRVTSFKEIAEAEGVSEQFVSNRISLAFLAPQIVESIHAGTQPADLTADALVKRIEIPLSWSEQVALLQPDGSLQG